MNFRAEDPSIRGYCATPGNSTLRDKRQRAFQLIETAMTEPGGEAASVINSRVLDHLGFRECHQAPKFPPKAKPHNFFKQFQKALA
ncbi:hypothetical protein UY3_17768 [Chelonia mydas]|uniref:Uncharacterized protein n=1 Tax=Chelonia mydas TaxID=8469 RepID=M7BA35_CHEMY|nr:hypothetical protein UY3_17768 [Chelonia mydas]